MALPAVQRLAERQGQRDESREPEARKDRRHYSEQDDDTSDNCEAAGVGGSHVGELGDHGDQADAHVFYRDRQVVSKTSFYCYIYSPSAVSTERPSSYIGTMP